MVEDFEVRVYVTVRDRVRVEWQVVTLLPGGQVEWRDGAVYPLAPMKPIVHDQLSQCVLRALRGRLLSASSGPR